MPSLAEGASRAARSRGALPARRLVPLVLGTAALALVWGRFTLEARRAVREAGVAASGGDRAEAVRCYLDALRVYVPGSPYERQALDGLDHLAAEARQAGDPAAEREALDAIRTGLFGTRGVIIPHRARLVAAENRLHQLDAAAGHVPSVELVSQHRRDPGRPSAVLSTLIALVGLATWVAAVALLVRARLEERPAPSPSSSPAGSGPAPVQPAAGLRYLVPALFLVGAVLFLAGLRFA
jgi:hypothetical protein